MKTMAKLLAVMVTCTLTFDYVWAAPAETVTGPGYYVDNQGAVLRSSRDGSGRVVQSHGRYTESSLRGAAFTCSNLAGTPVATQSALSLTTPALTLYNPVGSKILMVVQTWTVAPSTGVVLPVAFSLAMTSAPFTTTLGPPTAVTNATITSNIVGKNVTPSGSCYRVATLAVAPVAVRFLGSLTGLSSVVGTTAVPAVIKDYIDGEIILAEGTSLSIQTTAVAAGILNSVSWEEVTP